MNRTPPQRRVNETIDEFYTRLHDDCGREDLVMFINACFAATRQNEYYTDSFEQSVSIDFLHRYVMANYRRLYARTITTGINHFNQLMIVFHLLEAGVPTEKSQKEEEGELIAACLRGLPVNRVLGLFKSLQRNRVNNRRTRAVVKRYLVGRNDPVFDAVKYRNKYRAAASHAHLKIDAELGSFLFNFKSPRAFKTPLFAAYREAHYSASAIYKLPFTVAESLAHKHNIPRDRFLRNIEHKMTAAEKLRFQTTAKRSKNAKLNFDLGRAPLTKLALYVLSLPVQERLDRSEEIQTAFDRSAGRALSKSPLAIGRVAAVLDRSRSSAGSREKRNRPLAVALGAAHLLKAASKEFRSFWTQPIPGEAPDWTVSASGQTRLADPLLDALEWGPDIVLIISDGFENDPPLAADQVARIFRERIEPIRSKPIEIVHLNPVFDSKHYSPRSLGPTIPTVGLRDAEDLPTMLGFYRFSSGHATLSVLEDYLNIRLNQFLPRKDR